MIYSDNELGLGKKASLVCDYSMAYLGLDQENLDMSENLTAVREKSTGSQGKLSIAYWKFAAASVFDRLLQILYYPQ